MKQTIFKIINALYSDYDYLKSEARLAKTVMDRVQYGPKLDAGSYDDNDIRRW